MLALTYEFAPQLLATLVRPIVLIFQKFPSLLTIAVPVHFLYTLWCTTFMQV